MAESVIRVTCTDLEPVRRLIAAVSAFLIAAARDGYHPPELDRLAETIMAIRAEAPPVHATPGHESLDAILRRSQMHATYSADRMYVTWRDSHLQPDVTGSDLYGREVPL